MKKGAYICCLLFLATCALFSQQNNNLRIERVENGLRTYRWALFGDEKYFNILERMKFYRVPGVSIAVIENGTLVWAKAYGVKDFDTKEPVTIKTLFQAGSISKSLNAMAIMKKAEEGHFALDEDVNKHLKSWKLPSNQFSENRTITISNLLNHTGGTSDWNDRTGYLGYKTTDPVPTVLQILKGEPPAKTQPVVVERVPGAFHYSNGGTTILQLLLMEIENKAYDQIMKESVIDPLGMSNSTFMNPLPDSLKKYASSAHDRWRPLEGKYMRYYELAAAGLWTTPTDLAKYIIEHWHALHGKSTRIISQESAKKMIELPMNGSLCSRGFMIIRKDDEIYYGHRGGSYGFYSDMIINKNSGNGAIVMVNGGSDRVTSNLRREILNSIATEYRWKNYVRKIQVIPVTPRMKRFAGRFYVNQDNVMAIQEIDGKLTVQNPENPVRGTIDMFPISEEELAAKSILPLTFKLKEGTDIDTDTLVIYNSDGIIKACRMHDDKKVPYEYLSSGNIKKGIELYKELKQDPPSNILTSERRINAIGYYLLNKQLFKAAIALFTLNTEWYPESANTFDSLGEAYMKAGNKNLAIENYKKALMLDPNSNNARDMLKQLKESNY